MQQHPETDKRKRRRTISSDVFNDDTLLCSPGGIGDELMTVTDAVTPSDVWPCVGDGGGVAVTIDRCFSRIDSRIPANISEI